MDLIYAKLFFQEVAGDHNVKAVADPGEVRFFGLKRTGPFCSLNNRAMGVVWLIVGVFQGKSMKRTPLVRGLDPPRPP